MGKLDKFKVELRGMTAPTATLEMDIDNNFFALIDAPEVQKGKAQVTVNVTKKSGTFLLDFDINGYVIVNCDRCLDEMEQPIATTGSLSVKLGNDFGEDGDTVIVPERDGYINVAWYIYEFVALAIPLKHVHAPGKCNREMMDKLRKHTAREEDEEAADGNDPVETDPRWDALKDIMDN